MSSLNIRIKKVDNQSAALIALLARVTFTETFGHFFVNKQELQDYYQRTFSVEKLRTSLAKKNNVFWIATVDELPVGYAKLKLNSTSSYSDNKVLLDAGKTCQLQKIYILKDFLAMQIGQALQSTLFNEAQRGGYKNIWLSVLESNSRAINFYTKHGFQRTGEHDFSIGSVDFNFAVMHKVLQA